MWRLLRLIRLLKHPCEVLGSFFTKITNWVVSVLTIDVDVDDDDEIDVSILDEIAAKWKLRKDDHKC